MRRTLAVVGVVAAALLSGVGEAGRIWPQPKSVVYDDKTVFRLASRDKFSFRADIASTTLWLAFSRYRSLIFDTVPQTYANVGLVDDVLDSLYVHVGTEDETLDIGVTDESYLLAIDKNDRTGRVEASMYANTVYGALRGLESFSQLVDGVTSMPGARVVPAVKVADAPRFGFRGLLIDTSRHFLPVATILSIVDAMAYNKLNVLHWHITDDQSFPFLSTRMPRITMAGAFSRNHVYTPSDIAKIVAYARHRGIDVMVEIDTPGHTASWGRGYPSLLAQCYDKSGNATGLGPLDPTKESVYAAVREIFEEAAELFPSKLFHVGGDEVDFGCWDSNADIRRFMEDHNITSSPALQTYYMNRILDITSDMGKRTFVWQEVFDNGGNLRKDAIVHVWKNGGNFHEEVMAVTSAGFRAVVSSPWYLDNLSNNLDWQVYLNTEIATFANHTHPSLVLGGEACMWGEWVDATNVLPRIFPRASAVAERLWSTYGEANLNEAGDRLDEWRCKMISRGVQAQPIRSGYALQKKKTE